MSDLKYWIISVPAKQHKEDVYSTIQNSAAPFVEEGKVARFNVPNNLRVGTLDSLMSMSDDLNKLDNMVEHVAKKIGQQIYTLKEQKPAPNTIFLNIGEASLSDHIKKFQWNAAKYNVRLSVQELAQRFQEQVGAIEEEYRTKITDYTNVAHAVTQYERSLKANLTVRDLTDIVNVDDIVDSILYDLITKPVLMWLVSLYDRQQEKEWEAVYESFCTDPDNAGRRGVVEYVVPGSCRRVTEEGDQCLLSVTILKAFKELFKQEAVNHHVTIREVKIDKENYKSGREKYLEMQKEMKAKQNKLFQWCQTNFVEVFVAWTHLKCLRVHVESILRFGLPPDFVAAVVKPSKIAKEKKLREALESRFAQHGSVHLKDMEAADVPGFYASEKLYPYVYLSMDLDFCKD